MLSGEPELMGLGELLFAQCTVFKEQAVPMDCERTAPAKHRSGKVECVLPDPGEDLVVGLTGLEPVTLRLSSACSNQLSYRPVKVGGPGPRGNGLRQPPGWWS